MRRAELRGSAFGRFPPRPGPGDDAAADRLQRTLHRLQPDPLFRRRLRTSIVNYYVASREGHLKRSRGTRRQMGTLGRSVLYASVVLALGVGAVGAASQESLPGDPLYGVKLRLEEIRMQIAPGSAHNALAELALNERTRELERLVSAGAWDQVPGAVDRLAAAESVLLTADPEAADSPATSTALSVLRGVLENAPAAARPGLERAILSAGSEHGNAPNPAAATDEPRAKPSQAIQPIPPGHAADVSRGPR